LQLENVLNKNNVVSYGKRGDTFDPSLHEAVGMQETDKKEKDHTVEDVIQKGYKINNKIIRSAKVVINEYKG
jgi:molecular chaperone GrpE